MSQLRIDHAIGSKQLVREIARHRQRIQKVLEDANLKLGCVPPNVLGCCGTPCSRPSLPAF
ncbi:hypothetical protein [Paraburkholderia sp. RL17-337-BIB-A]|uniref:hypothetical protein n=1 Tax=Paraburkholderia sp. RL17-337-BIB-A TaxID=3031636 RepID=UPI0038BBBD9D